MNFYGCTLLMFIGIFAFAQQKSVEEAFYNGNHQQVIDLVQQQNENNLNTQDLNYAGLSAQSLYMYNEAETFFKAANSKEPKNRTSLYGLAKTLQNVSRYDESTGYYKKLLEIEPQKISIYINIGSNEYKLGNNKAALDQFELAYDKDSLNTFVIQNLAKINYQIGAKEKSLEYLKKMQNRLGLDNMAPTHLLMMSRAYFSTGNDEEGIQCLNFTVNRYPKYAPAINTLAIRNFKLKAYETADSLFCRYVDLQTFVKPEILRNIAICKYHLKEYSEAMEQFESLVLVTPEDFTIHFYLGLIHKNQEEYDLAAAYFKTASQLVFPFDASTIYHNLGRSYSKLGQYDEAIKMYTRVVELDPENTLVLLDLATCYDENIKNSSAALIFYKHYINKSSEIKAETMSYVSNRMRKIKEENFMNE